MGNYNIPTSAVIFDVDGTLADCEHRRHFVIGKKKMFTKFYEAMGDDTRNEVVCQLNRMYNTLDWYIIICTGRPEKYRSITEKWLKDNVIFYDELRMRPDHKPYEPDTKIKLEMLTDIRKTRQVHVAIDDRNKVVKMWRDNGVACFQVAEGDF